MDDMKNCILILACFLLAGCAIPEKTPAERFAKLQHSHGWWQQFFMKHHADNPFSTANKTNVVCVVALRYRFPRFYIPYIITRQGFAMPDAQPQVYPMWRQYASDAAIEFLCDAQAMREPDNDAGLWVTYLDRTGVIKGFRCLSSELCKEIPDDPGHRTLNDPTMRFGNHK